MYDRNDEARVKFLDMCEHVKLKTKELATVESKLQKRSRNMSRTRCRKN
jgi:hypothetical protein